MQCREREFPLLQNVQTCCMVEKYYVEWALILKGPVVNSSIHRRLVSRYH